MASSGVWAILLIFGALSHVQAHHHKATPVTAVAIQPVHIRVHPQPVVYTPVVSKSISVPTINHNMIEELIHFKRHAVSTLLGTLIRSAARLCRPSSCANMSAPTQRHCCRTSDACCPLRPVPAVTQYQTVAVLHKPVLTVAVPVVPAEPRPVPEHPAAYKPPSRPAPAYTPQERVPTTRY